MARRREQLGWAEPALLILTSLAGGPKHGYLMIKDIAETSNVTLGPGTLYAAIARLEENGFVEPLDGDERRRPYRITAIGQKVLAERLATMKKFSSLGLARLAGATA